VEALCTDLKLVQAARQAERARVQQQIDKIETELEAKLAAARREGAEECERKIAAIKEAGKLEPPRHTNSPQPSTPRHTPSGPPS